MSNKNNRKSVDAHSHAQKDSKESKKAAKEKEKREKKEREREEQENRKRKKTGSGDSHHGDSKADVKREKSNRELKEKDKSSGSKKNNTEKKLLAVVCSFVVDEPFVAPLFLKFVRSSQAEEIAHELVNMFYAKHKHTEAIVEDAIFYVAQEYPNGNELLRSTNIFVAVLSECARLGGHRYLTRVLGSHVKRICGHENDGETDSLQLWTNDQSKNTPLIVEYATGIMDQIMKSAPNLPMFLKQMMIALHKTMSRNKSNPVSGSMLISAFLFLRFICPALVSPHCYGLVRDPPTISAQRMLVSIAKMLQAVVNNKIENPTATPTVTPTKATTLKKTNSLDSSESLPLPSASSASTISSESSNGSDSETSGSDLQRRSTSRESHEEPAPETEHEIAVSAFIQKYSYEVEVYAIAVLDKKGDCDGKRFYKVTQQKEYGRAALDWMQANKEHLIEYLMKNKQIRDKLAFEQFLSKVSNGELDGNSRSPRLFKNSIGIGRRKKETEAKDEEAYEKQRLHHKRELRKTKRKEEEKALARNKEKEHSRDNVAAGISSASAATTQIERSQSSPSTKKESISSGAIMTRGSGRSQISSTAPGSGSSTPLGTSPSNTPTTPTKGNSSNKENNVDSPGLKPRLLSPLNNGRNDSWVFLTDDSSGEDDSDTDSADPVATRRRHRRPSIVGGSGEESGGSQVASGRSSGGSGLAVSGGGNLATSSSAVERTTTTTGEREGPKGKEVEDAEAVSSSAPTGVKASG